jgi:prephenate dehydrogenase
MWRDIFDQNREALAEALAAFRAALGDLESLVRSGDGARIEAELERIRALRERLG